MNICVHTLYRLRSLLYILTTNDQFRLLADMICAKLTNFELRN